MFYYFQEKETEETQKKIIKQFDDWFSQLSYKDLYIHIEDIEILTERDF